MREPIDWIRNLPPLGVGVGFRPALRAAIGNHRQEVDFLEIVADHYLDAAADKRRELNALREQFTIIPHAVDLSLGSAEGIDTNYLERLASLIALLEPPYWSEHIAFTKAGGYEIGHLSPLPRTKQMVEAFVRNVAIVQQRIPVPLVLENITYTIDMPGEMSEAEFINALTEQTDCGLLLDVTNVYTNSVNQGFDAREFLADLPMDRVVQMHFVGGHWRGEWLVDSHGYATPPEVWELFEFVCQASRVKGAILERDDNFPRFRELAEELSRAREIGRRHDRWQ